MLFNRLFSAIAIFNLQPLQRANANSLWLTELWKGRMTATSRGEDVSELQQSVNKGEKERGVVLTFPEPSCGMAWGGRGGVENVTGAPSGDGEQPSNSLFLTAAENEYKLGNDTNLYHLLKQENVLLRKCNIYFLIASGHSEHFPKYQNPQKCPTLSEPEYAVPSFG